MRQSIAKELRANLTPSYNKADAVSRAAWRQLKKRYLALPRPARRSFMENMIRAKAVFI